ncbi:MAG TPA: ribonuclease Z [Miltoncostaeaceae bacterium]|nr:ribonuclease Z [Miltoncostaeaceae bacterium]
MDLFVTFIGTAASVPTATRSTAATLIARGGDRWLVDCGEGTQRQLLRSGLGLVDVDVVLLTHLHGDHLLGLPGLLKTYGLRERDRPLAVIGPPGLAGLLERLGVVVGRTPYPIWIEETGPGVVLETAGARMEAFHTDHSVPSLGYALVEDPRPGAFDLAAARALGIPEGPLYGRLQRGEAVALPDGREVRPGEVLGPQRPGRTVVLSGDTRPCAGTEAAATGATLLVHEATFLEDEAQRAIETRHSTAREAAELAARAGVELLALTHLSSRTLPREARRQAEEAFPDVIVPRDFDQVELPFPERGGPVVHRGGDGGVGRGARVAASGDPGSLSSDDL